jgi:hypothetical protein
MSLENKTSAVAEENKEQNGMVEIPHEYLIEGVKKAVKDVLKMMNDARLKYGNRYNKKNDYEVFDRRFGYNDPEKLWAEFELIWQKKSNQPAALRKVITAIGLSARDYALHKYAMEQKKTNNVKAEEK